MIAENRLQIKSKTTKIVEFNSYPSDGKDGKTFQWVTLLL